MTTTTINYRFRLRNDTAAAWAGNNPTLLDGEPGIEDDTGRWKLGDGTTAWADLPYVDELWPGAGGATAATTTFAPAGGLAATDVQAALVELDTEKATLAQVQAAVDALVAAAPGTLDTLAELAAALGSDPNFATTVTNALAAKASSADLATTNAALAAKADAAVVAAMAADVTANSNHRTRNTLVNVLDYGAKGDGVLMRSVSMVAGSNIVTADVLTGGLFHPGLVGGMAFLPSAGPGAGQLLTTVTQYDSPTQIRLAANAGTTQAPGTAGGAFGQNELSAFAAAFAAMTNISDNGGTLYVPDGTYLVNGLADIWVSAQGQSIANAIWRGNGGSSRIVPVGGSVGNNTPFFFNGGESLTIRDLLFMGVNGANDCDCLMSVGTDRIIIDNVGFYGIRATDTTLGMLYLQGAQVKLRNLRFAGCANTGGPIVHIANGWGDLQADDIWFPDFGILNGQQWGKTTQSPSAATDSWVKIGEPDNQSGANFQQNGIRIRNFRCDEGAIKALDIAPPSLRIDYVDLENVQIMVLTAPLGRGIKANNVRRLNIRNARIYSNIGATETAIELLNVGHTELDHVDTVASGAYVNTAPVVTADASCGSLVLDDCTIGTLTSAAGKTIIRSGGTGGVVPTVTAGVPTDAAFQAPPPNGTLAINGTTGDLYRRQAGAWGLVGGGGGVTDHGALTGNADDDHPQYLLTAEGQALVDTHSADTTVVHGIADTAALARQQVNVYTTTGETLWTKPTWAKTVRVVVQAGGAGGGAGRKGAAGTARTGGGGGPGGGLSHAILDAADLPAGTTTVGVGAGGAGGAAQTVDSTNGADGVGGGASYFGPNFSAYVRAGAGNGGQGGKLAAASTGNINGLGTLYGGIGGASSATGGVGVVGGISAGGPGGGSGGGLTTANVASAGGAGGPQQTRHGTSAPAGGAIGAAGGDATSTHAPIDGVSGQGGGGGGSAASGPAGRGGHGIAGSGGGGGGASVDGADADSGAGGNGGNGYVVVVATG